MGKDESTFFNGKKTLLLLWDSALSYLLMAGWISGLPISFLSHLPRVISPLPSFQWWYSFIEPFLVCCVFAAQTSFCLFLGCLLKLLVERDWLFWCFSAFVLDLWLRPLVRNGFSVDEKWNFYCNIGKWGSHFFLRLFIIVVIVLILLLIILLFLASLVDRPHQLRRSGVHRSQWECRCSRTPGESELWRLRTTSAHFTMVQNRKKHSENAHLIFHFPTSWGVSERANKWTN